MAHKNLNIDDNKIDNSTISIKPIETSIEEAAKEYYLNKYGIIEGNGIARPIAIDAFLAGYTLAVSSTNSYSREEVEKLLYRFAVKRSGCHFPDSIVKEWLNEQ